MQQAFTFIGISINKWTLAYGLFLIVCSSVASVLTSFQSITSWIPAILGLPVFLMGVACVIWPAKNKIWIHIAMLFGLIGLAGGFNFLSPLFNGGNVFSNPIAGVSKLVMLLSSGMFLVACVRSFIWARSHQPSEIKKQ